MDELFLACGRVDDFAILDSWPYVVSYVVVGVGVLVVWVPWEVFVLAVGGLAISAIVFDACVRSCVVVVEVALILGNFGFLFRTYCLL